MMLFIEFPWLLPLFGVALILLGAFAIHASKKLSNSSEERVSYQNHGIIFIALGLIIVVPFVIFWYCIYY